MRWVAGRPPGCLPSRRSKGRVEGRWRIGERSEGYESVGGGSRILRELCRKYSFGCSRGAAGGGRDEGWTAGLARGPAAGGGGCRVLLCCADSLAVSAVDRTVPTREIVGSARAGPPLGSGCWGRPQTTSWHVRELGGDCRGVRHSVVPVPSSPTDEHVKFGFG